MMMKMLVKKWKMMTRRIKERMTKRRNSGQNLQNNKALRIKMRKEKEEESNA